MKGIVFLAIVAGIVIGYGIVRHSSDDAPCPSGMHRTEGTAMSNPFGIAYCARDAKIIFNP